MQMELTLTNKAEQSNSTEECWKFFFSSLENCFRKLPCSSRYSLAQEHWSGWILVALTGYWVGWDFKRCNIFELERDVCQSLTSNWMKIRSIKYGMDFRTKRKTPRVMAPIIFWWHRKTEASISRIVAETELCH